jgi:hypothetical protein
VCIIELSNQLIVAFERGKNVCVLDGASIVRRIVVCCKHDLEQAIIGEIVIFDVGARNVRCCEA